MADTTKSKDILRKQERYVSLSPDCTIRLLERPHLYNIQKDVLYEIDNAAFAFLIQCDGSRRIDQLKPEPEFFRFCLQEGILKLHPELRTDAQPRPMEPVLLFSPSLRYLDLKITSRRSFQSSHCNLDVPRLQDLSPADIQTLLIEFYHLQGLKVIISGQPLLHPDREQILELMSSMKLRKIIQIIDTPVTLEVLRLLKGIQEVRISLDGLKKGHERLRGEGTFEQALDSIGLCRSEGFVVSVATTLHQDNLDEIEQLSFLLHKMGVKEWGINVPRDNNAEEKCRFYGLTAGRIAPCLKLAFGESIHSSNEILSRDSHLCTIMPDGSVCKYGCTGPIGHIQEGLGRCWARMTRPSSLERAGCSSCTCEQEHGGSSHKHKKDKTGK
ncbi:MAG: radical SAM protein [bacterium]